jgi:hypothetical protein
MTSVPDVPAKTATARKLKEARDMIATWTDERDRYIRKAMDEGGSAREVAELAGISHTWVLKIWRDET